MRGHCFHPAVLALFAVATLAGACGGATSTTIAPPPDRFGEAGSSCQTDADCPAGSVCTVVVVGEVQEHVCVPSETPDAGSDAPSDASGDAAVLPAACGPSLESPIGTSPQLWLKAECLGLADGAAVATWADARGTGLVATQTTASAQPRYAASAIGQKPVVRFTQASQAFLSLPAGVIDSTYTLVAVGAPTSSARLTFVGASDPHLFGFGVDAPTSLFLFSFGVGIGEASAGAHVYSGAVAAGWGNVWVTGLSWSQDGGWVGSGNSEPTSTTFAFIGRYFSPDTGWHYSDGDMAEILLFDSILSDSDRGAVESYLKVKYSL